MRVENYGWADHAPGSADYINPAVLRCIRKAGGSAVLDAGCGNGELAGFLAQAGFNVVGVDADERGVAIATERFPQCRFEVGTFVEKPPGTFDIVTSTEVVEHLFSPHELARYCFDALAPGGSVVMSTPYHGYFKNLALAVTGRWSRHLAPNWHGGHIKFWDRRSLTQLLESAGFEITDFHGLGRASFFWKSMILVGRKPKGSAET